MVIVFIFAFSMFITLTCAGFTTIFHLLYCSYYYTDKLKAAKCILVALIISPIVLLMGVLSNKTFWLIIEEVNK